MLNQEICLLNDSFPPLIDGVANAVVNYATNLPDCGYNACVATPDYPGADDSGFAFPVVRYPSVDLRKQLGYTAGNPFVPRTIEELKKRPIALLHSHCPMASNFLARGVRERLNVPLVMTYHTKFDIDIANAIRSKVLQKEAIRAIVESVSAVDELWVVSEGAGQNIRSLGYSGDYIVMPNGVDMPKHRSSPEEIAAATQGYDLPNGVPVFLFVGRLMWYKGLRIIADALAAMKYQGIDFRMVFIGKGGDEAEVKQYISSLKLDDRCLFTGAIHDRSVLAAWYSRADLFLFPSTFDTNGLVVREAAACSLGTVMIEGSCAAEGVENGTNGLFIEENAVSLAVCLTRICQSPELMHRIGENAARDLYLSWGDAVKNAAERYGVVIEKYFCGEYRKRHDLADEFITFRSELLEMYENMETRYRRLEDRIEDRLDRYL